MYITWLNTPYAMDALGEQRVRLTTRSLRVVVH